MTKLRHIALATLAAPLALALSACGEDATGTGGLSGEPIAPIAAPEGQSWNRTAVVTEMGGIQIGNPDAPIKLVEYASHTCPGCAFFSQESSSGLDEYVATGVVSFELRNQVHDPLDLTFAALIRCGDPASAYPLAKQGWADLNTLREGYVTGQAGLEAAAQQPPETRFQAIGEALGLVDWFAARGISRDQSLACLANADSVQQIIDNSTEQSEELGVTGTPTFFLNGSKITETRWSEVERVLQQAGAR